MSRTVTYPYTGQIHAEQMALMFGVHRITECEGRVA